MGALQQERDAAQRFDGLHASHRTQVLRDVSHHGRIRRGRPVSSLVVMAGDKTEMTGVEIRTAEDETGTTGNKTGMARDETEDAPNLLRAVLRNGILAALVTGRAEPAPPLDRPW